LDLGGTNLRVVLVTLEGHGKFKTVSTKAKVSEALKTGPMRDLCGKSDLKLKWMDDTDTNRCVTMGMIDYIADCIDRFLTEQNLGSVDEDLPLGYTFSFPVLQSKVN
jgi:hexokinase